MKARGFACLVVMLLAMICAEAQTTGSLRVRGGGITTESTIAPMPGGGFVTAGWTSPLFDNEIMVSMVDATGSMVWRRSLGVNPARAAADGGLLTWGSFNTRHDWYVRSVHVVSPTRIALVGSVYTTQSDTLVVWIDDRGRVVRSRTYGVSGDDYAMGALTTEEGGLVLVGSARSNRWADDLDLRVLELDADGDIVSDRAYSTVLNDYGRAIARTPDGGLAVAGSRARPWEPYKTEGDAWVVKLDVDGEISWQVSYGLDDWDRFQSVAALSDGSVVVAGFGSSGRCCGRQDGRVARIGDRGELIWERFFDGASNEAFYAIGMAQNGDVLLAGERFDVDGWVMRLEPSGAPIWSRNYYFDSEFGRDEQFRAIYELDDGRILSGGNDFGGTVGVFLTPNGRIDGGCPLLHDESISEHLVESTRTETNASIWYPKATVEDLHLHSVSHEGILEQICPE